MQSITVGVRQQTRAALQKLAAETGEPMKQVLADAVEAYRRRRFLEGANADYARLRADPVAWKEELEERAAWDVTLMVRTTRVSGPGHEPRWRRLFDC